MNDIKRNELSRFQKFEKSTHLYVFFYHFSENSHFLVHNLVLKLKRQVIRKHS